MCVLFLYSLFFPDLWGDPRLGHFNFVIAVFLSRHISFYCQHLSLGWPLPILFAQPRLVGVDSPTQRAVWRWLLSNALQCPGQAVPVWSPQDLPCHNCSCFLWVLWLWLKWTGVHKTPGMESSEVAEYFRKSSVSVMSTLSIISNVLGESFVSLSKAIFLWRKRKLA